MYINLNFEGMRDDVITMIGGGKVDVNVISFLNTMTDFRSRNDVFTYLIHLGYLAYDIDTQQCYIPNNETREHWMLSIAEEPAYSDIVNIINESKSLLEATINKDEEAVASATGGYCLNIDAYNNDTGKTSKYAISWNGKLPEKAGSINTICHFNKTSRLLSIVLENGEFQSIYIDSNGGLKCTGKMHLYGTNEIHIFSKDDWNAYAAFVNNGYFNTGFKVIIDRKLDFKGQNVTPLGTAKYPFRNEFDGNGLEIGNGKIVTTESSVGLFGYADNAKINNFTVYSLKIDAGDKVGIIGNLVNSTASNIRVTDCPIKGKTGVGTVGYASNATITGVFVTDRMSVSGNENVGGVCGYTNKDVTIKNCWNAADISGNSNIGGIVGTSIYTGRERSHETYVFGCFNAGSVTAKKQNVGGIAGCFYDILFMRCQSFGKAVIK